MIKRYKDEMFNGCRKQLAGNFNMKNNLNNWKLKLGVQVKNWAIS